jgi:hypothetical protein
VKNRIKLGQRLAWAAWLVFFEEIIFFFGSNFNGKALSDHKKKPLRH